MNGIITDDWITYANLSTTKKRIKENFTIKKLATWKMVAAVGEGIINQLVDEGVGIVTSLWLMFDMIPQMIELAELIKEQGVDALLDSIKEQLLDEYVKPFEEIAKNFKKISSREVTYEPRNSEETSRERFSSSCP
ncbi:hypothetical protein PAECIP111893_02755 [Paenibacillus plantiphilus]|uniref:Uncharacterized protein n=1 Tax=Paenibacillus plantiphilus TaxID=2905650 RepID=A0ABM9CBH5_9BACL|nr:hypothetical protein [Paenibacillus plantiphilus]CAH1207682.1 hypothetical protein PAECIP111893_02755 [Paenibacillus plantiphilus]